MWPKRLPNGNILTPRRAEGDGAVGDAWIELVPDDPGYEQAEADLRRQKELFDEEEEG